MDEVEFHREPPSNLPTLVTAFGGWIDAGTQIQHGTIIARNPKDVTPGRRSSEQGAHSLAVIVVDLDGCFKEVGNDTGTGRIIWITG